MINLTFTKIPGEFTKFFYILLLLFSELFQEPFIKMKEEIFEFFCKSLGLFNQLHGYVTKFCTVAVAKDSSKRILKK